MEITTSGISFGKMSYPCWTMCIFWQNVIMICRSYLCHICFSKKDIFGYTWDTPDLKKMHLVYIRCIFSCHMPYLSREGLRAGSKPRADSEQGSLHGLAGSRQRWRWKTGRTCGASWLKLAAGRLGAGFRALRCLGEGGRGTAAGAAGRRGDARGSRSGGQTAGPARGPGPGEWGK